jgi:hypothetical protein
MGNEPLIRRLYTFDEAVQTLGTDVEGFRQALLYQLERPEQHSWIRACVDSHAGHYLAKLEGECSPPLVGWDDYGFWDRCGSDRRTGYSDVYELCGVFVVSPRCIRWIAGDAKGDDWRISNLLAVAPVSQTAGGDFPDVNFVIVSEPGPESLPVPSDARELMFLASDIDRWASDAKPRAEDKPLDTRERTNLLRIIRALSVMAKLPARGATPSLEKQLQQLGFSGPKDATIRSVLADARALEPDL